jgi:hypothetical protein
VVSRGDALQAFDTLPNTPARQLDTAPGALLVTDGSVVEDLGETFACGDGASESDVLRRVRVQGRSVWLLASWTWNTGHDFVGEDVLVPVR